jgi:diguanylate cyclase (GGDEF)-like protein
LETSVGRGWTPRSTDSLESNRLAGELSAGSTARPGRARHSTSPAEELAQPWARSEPAEGFDHRAGAATTFGALSLLAAAVVVATLLAPGDPDRDAIVLAASAALFAVIGLGLLFGGDSLPFWVVHASLAVGLVVIAVVVAVAGSSAAGVYSIAFPLAVLPGFYYFDPRVALGYALLATAAFGGALLVDDDVPLRAARLITGVAAMGAVALIMVRLRRRTDDLHGRLDLAARTDPLTGLANRREFNSRFAHEIARAERSGQPLGVLIVDLDGFKAVNDTHGHKAGDLVLARLGTVLRDSTRTTDLVARIGGEEFGILAPDAGPEEALALAERIRRATMSSLSDEPPALTASCGVATYPRSGVDADDLLRAADRALYAAKRDGRNRSVLNREGSRFYPAAPDPDASATK